MRSRRPHQSLYLREHLESLGDLSGPVPREKGAHLPVHVRHCGRHVLQLKCTTLLNISVVKVDNLDFVPKGLGLFSRNPAASILAAKIRAGLIFLGIYLSNRKEFRPDKDWRNWQIWCLITLELYK